MQGSHPGALDIRPEGLVSGNKQGDSSTPPPKESWWDGLVRVPRPLTSKTLKDRVADPLGSIRVVTRMPHTGNGKVLDAMPFHNLAWVESSIV